MSAGGAARGARGLRRSLTLPLLVLYGLGTTVGAGIYALTGAVAAEAGMLSFVAFAAAALLASASAASYAALGSRYPAAAAEAVFVREAFGRRELATAMGITIALAGCVSAATVTNGFVAYLIEIAPLPESVAILVVVAGLGAIGALGVRQSVGTAAWITAVELGGLLLVLAYASPAVLDLPERVGEFAVAQTPRGVAGLFTGSFIAFFAFLGFEDIVNVGEEVREPNRSIPVAIALTLAITLALYALVATAAVLVVPPAELAESSAPLALVFERSGGSPVLLAGIGVLAMLNGALIQVLMAARICFGLARDGDLPGWLAYVHPRTAAPLTATVAVSATIALLAVAFPIAPLAQGASLLTLMAFALVNASLIQVQRRIAPPEGALVISNALPWTGLLVSAGMVVARVVSMFVEVLGHSGS